LHRTQFPISRREKKKKERKNKEIEIFLSERKDKQILPLVITLVISNGRAH